MEGFVVSARKYRPDTFDSVVGQSHVTNTLKNAIKMGQLAHAFLFSGPRGVGKTTCARILAKAINCQNLSESGEPCNQCESCESFNSGRSLNIHELDAASNNSVEDIRKIIEQVRYVPTAGRKSVFIIDEVHMLSQAAFNAFLKTLEEPPPHAIFILATTEKHKILPTILSRVQKFDFRRIKVNDIANHLKGICEKESVAFELDALQLIGLKADGALRDGLSIFDQIVSFSSKNVTYDIVVENLQVLDYDYYFKAVDQMLAGDHESLLLMLNEILDRGFEAKSFMVGLTEHFRNLMVARTPKTLGLLETSDNVRKRYLEQVKAVDPSWLLNAFNLASTGEQNMRGLTHPRLHIELHLIKLAHLKSAISTVVAEKKKLTNSQNEKINPPPSISQAIPQAAPSSEHQTEGKRLPLKEKRPSKLKKSSSFSGGFKIPKSLKDIDLNAKKNQEEETGTEDFVTFNPDFKIDTKAFEKAYEELLQKLENKRNFIVSGAMNKAAYELKGNKWVQQVPTDLAKKALFEEKEVLTFMRERLAIPNLMLEIEVSETALPTHDTKPYTNEEKLRIMLEKNPALKDFMKRFDTMISF